jgi:hypothetical protein
LAMFGIISSDIVERDADAGAGSSTFRLAV